MPVDPGASDAALLVAVGRLHQDALAVLYDRHGAAVYGLARRVLGARELAEEVTQEVFLRLWNRPERFDPARGSLRSFLLADTHGRAVDLIRSETARRDREEREARLAAPRPDDVEGEILRASTSEQVRRAVEQLSDGERRAIELAYFGGHTYRQVADILGEPEGTVKSRIRTGLKRLRASLQAAGAM